jgi:hypothetical protein
MAQLVNPITEKTFAHQHVEGGNCEIEDSDLMGRIQSRDEKAFETLIKRYSAILRSVVGRRIAVEQDVTEEKGSAPPCWLSGLTRRGSLRLREKVGYCDPSR